MTEFFTWLLEVVKPAVITLSQALFSFDMVLIIISGMTLTWVIKVSIKYGFRDPKNWMIVWLLSPLSACLPALLIWPNGWKQGLVVGITAAFIASTAWWLLINKIAYKVKPEWVDQLNNPWANTPVDRRKKNRGKIIKERRKGG